MKWSWKIARLGGVDLRVHATFFLLLAWMAVVTYREAGTLAGAARGVLFTLALFASVVLHELGHAMMARRFGVSTHDITLLPIGGVAQLEHMPEQPKHELGIALAGPAVTVGIIAILYATLRLLHLPVLPSDGPITLGGRFEFMAQLMWVNVSLLAFNLLPAFPLDGGRVVRAALGLRMPYVRATEIAARLGRMFALIFGILGMLYNPFLVLIGLFVWFGAATESATIRTRSLLEDVDVERVMIRNVSTLAPSDTLATAVGLVLGGFQQEFPVVENGKVVGVLTQAGLLQALARSGPATAVAAAMDTSFQTATPHEPANVALARLGDLRSRTLPVLSNGRLAGVLTLENIAEFVTLETASRSSPAAQPTG